MNIKEELLKYLQSSNEVRSFLSIAKGLNIKPNKNKELTKVLQECQQNFLIFKNEKDEYFAPVFKEEIEGNISISNNGKFAFVDYNINEELNTKNSVFIIKNNFNGAIHNDLVVVKIFEDITRNKEQRLFGVVSKIKQRMTNQLIGFVKQKGIYVDFEPIDKKFKFNKYKIVGMKQQANLNDLVTVKIEEITKSFILVSIEKVITNDADTKLFIKAYLEGVNVPKIFPDSLESEVSLIPQNIDNENKENREDFTNDLIVTIDGDDTKDFDDAINVVKLDNGNYLLSVHIADVSYYVREGSKINEEALKRGTSIYLADKVIPMLPEALSNGICSLNPNEKRFVLSCIMEIDNSGKTVKTVIKQGIIDSKYRLTYKQVNDFYDTQVIKNEWFSSNPNLNSKEFGVDNLSKMLNEAKELSLILHKFKVNEGYIDFEIQEPKILFNEDGSVKDITFYPRGFSEELIEDFMVRANEEVAKYLSGHHFPAMYRVHEKPDEERLLSFRNVLSTLGVKVVLPIGQITPLIYSGIIEKIKEQRNDEFIKMLFLRTMQKAVYSGDNLGHFGLASQCYCHFTSPIRRYPDLVIHRILRELVLNKDISKKEELTNLVFSVSKANSASEQGAVEIERKVNDLLFSEYYKNKIGTVLKGQIVSVVKFGFFVEFENKTNALVHKSVLQDDTLEPNDTMTQLKGKNDTYTIGSYIDVVVAAVDLVDGKVDCVPQKFYQDFLNQKINRRAVEDKHFRKN
ncbi:ribonuclease R [Mycoplasma crocodyli]|uniref:Ribonuclease R n=1 Tax=Mycoplasma crocodyli (strain ATCC 51981 / MP145) TaxID=512564 RepID=D5E4Y9_MYCCM|nr:ribonuclease R [Mycoplasma crocodyli]ADE19794.1 VacB-like exoribonuclease R [Mycoplasma crocodyli MP145]